MPTVTEYLQTHVVHRVTPSLDSKAAIFLYGTGNFAREVRSLLESKGFLVEGFLDHRKGKPQLDGLKVLSPDALPPVSRSEGVVVLGIHNRDADLAAIMTNLNALGYRRVWTPFDLMDAFSYEMGDRYWLTKRDHYLQHAGALEQVLRLFEEGASRDLFWEILRFRTTGDYGCLRAPDLKNQYFSPDLPGHQKPLRLMDCGAFDGDTVRTMLDLNIPLEALAAFEPDGNNFLKLVATVRDNAVPNAFLWPCGVHSHTVQMRFSTGKGEASGISGQGDSFIQCVSLDDAAPGFAPTMIKMDIEGAEVDALLGAEKTIARFQPILAVCTYHTPDHFWEIPLLVDQIVKRNGLHYSYYFRSYGQNSFDSVFFGFPSDAPLFRRDDA